MPTQTSEAILDRNQVRGSVVKLKPSITTGGLSQTIENPYRPITPFNLTNLLFLLHKKKNLVPHWERKRYWRSAKKLIDEVGPEEAERMTIEAGKLARLPWTFKFVRTMKKG